jgi:hypothetical protein
MAIRLSTTLKDALINAAITYLAGTAGSNGTASLEIRTGSQPADADTAPTGTLLCTIGSFGWDAATDGEAVLPREDLYTGTAVATGTAGWASITTVGAAGTYRIDGGAGTGTAGDNDFTLNSIIITSGDTIELYDTKLA